MYTIFPCHNPPTRLAITVGGLSARRIRIGASHPHNLTLFSSNLKDLSVSLPLPYLNAFLASSYYKYASLESLSIDCQPHRMRSSWADWGDDEPESDFVDSFYTSKLFGRMLNLRKLKINLFKAFSLVLLRLPVGPSGPWEQLTELDLDGIKQRSMMAANILRRCKRLESCRLWICNDLEPTEIEEFTLVHLRSLQVTGHSPGDLFFTQLIAPSLVELRVCVTTDEHDLIDILSMIRRSGSSLRVFAYITNDKMIAVVGGIEEFLELTPSLVEFDSYAIFPQASLDKFSRLELWPFLEVWRCGVDFSAIDAFVDAIEARLMNTAEGSNRLRDVWVRIPSMGDGDDMRVEAGMKRMKHIQETYNFDFRLAEDA